MWVGCRVAESWSWAAWGGGVSPRDIRGTAVLALVLAACFWRLRAARVLAVLVTCGFAAGLAVSALQGFSWQLLSARAAEAGARDYTGVVEADSTVGQYGATVRVKITGGPLDGARVRVGWPEGCEVPELGRVVKFAVIVRPLPADEVWSRRTARAGACATGTAWRAEVGGWRRGIEGSLLAWRSRALGAMGDIPGAGGDLLQGIVLGDRSRLVGTVTDEDFRILGLSHLVAVSGSHLALACGAVALLGSALRVPRRALAVLTLAAGAAYAVVTGMPYSALRSLLMLAVGALAVLSGRRGNGLDALAVSVIVVLVVEPWSVFDLGFQLSVLAVGGLLLFGGAAQCWATEAVDGRMRGFVGTIALTLVAQALTTPVVASAFGMMSVMAPLANAYAGPAVSAAMFVGLTGALAGSVAPELAGLLGRLAAALLGATAWFSHVLAGLPGAAVAFDAGPLVTLGIGAFAIAVWVVWPLPRSRREARVVGLCVLGVCVALALGPAPPRRASLVMLDVGQGDALLVRDGGRTMLVDAGPDPIALRSALAEHGVRRIDVLVFTHAHDDHVDGAPGLSGVASIGWIGVPCLGPEIVDDEAPWPGPDADVRMLAAGDAWQLGATEVCVLWPPAESEVELDTNDTSVVVHVKRGGFDAVLTGDAEAEAQRGMADANALREVEVLKVPHHGSTNGLTAEALALWDPDIALISVGAGNRFGHPCPETLALLAEAGTPVLRTDVNGEVTVRIGDDGYRVSPESGGGVAALRARMGDRRQGAAACGSAAEWCRNGPICGEELCGGFEHRRAEARLPDLRRRGAASRARAPPTPGPGRLGG